MNIRRRRSPARTGLAVVVLMVLTVPDGALGQEEEPPACGDLEAYHRLDFWVGRWEVREGDRNVGDNRIEKIVGGCALMEHWTSAAGGEGKSLFYHVPATGEWKQVWVTARATRPGGLKEKTLVAEYGGPGVRFQGRVVLPNGGSVLDRTTLTPLGGGRVRQVIETSSDEGETWPVRFDAVYLPLDDDLLNHCCIGS